MTTQTDKQEELKEFTRELKEAMVEVAQEASTRAWKLAIETAQKYLRECAEKCVGVAAASAALQVAADGMEEFKALECSGPERP